MRPCGVSPIEFPELIGARWGAILSALDEPWHCARELPFAADLSW